MLRSLDVMRAQAPRLVMHAAFLSLSLIFATRVFSLADLGSHAMTDGDPALNAWSVQWVGHALVTDPRNIFGGNTFFPYPQAVTLTDPMVTLALATLPLRLVTSNPWVGYNLLIVAAYYLSCVWGAALARHITRSEAAAWWGGIFWGFLFFRMHHIGHLQILSFQGIPLALLAMIRLRERPGALATVIFVAACLAQALVSWYLAVMLAVVLAVVAVGQRLAPGSSSTRPVVSRHEVLAVVVIGLVLFPFALPYARSFSDSTLAERRQLVDTFGDAVGWRDFVTPPAATLVGGAIDGNPYSIWGENTLYIGVVPCILTLVTIAVAARRREELRWTAIGLVLVVAGFTLSLGFVSPALGVRLPLGHLAQALPFLAGLRAVQRFSLVLYTGVLLLSVWGVAHLARNSRRPWLPAALASCLFLVEVFPITLPISAGRRYRVSEPDAFIAAYQHAHPDRAPVVVLHLPIHYFDESYPVSESTYMVDSTAHWARVLNGFSGGVPNGFMARMELLHRLPAPEAVDAMLALGVEILALHGPAAASHPGSVRDHFMHQSWAAVTPLPGGDAVVVIDRARAPAPGTPQRAR